MNSHNILIRAFELARTGQYRNVGELERALVQEGYSSNDPHLRGASVRRQLRDLCRETAAAQGAFA